MAPCTEDGAGSARDALEPALAADAAPADPRGREPLLGARVGGRDVHPAQVTELAALAGDGEQAGLEVELGDVRGEVLAPPEELHELARGLRGADVVLLGRAGRRLEGVDGAGELVGLALRLRGDAPRFRVALRRREVAHRRALTLKAAPLDRTLHLLELGPAVGQVREQRGQANELVGAREERELPEVEADELVGLLAHNDAHVLQRVVDAAVGDARREARERELVAAHEVDGARDARDLGAARLTVALQHRVRPEEGDGEPFGGRAQPPDDERVGVRAELDDAGVAHLRAATVVLAPREADDEVRLLHEEAERGREGLLRGDGVVLLIFDDLRCAHDGPPCWPTSDTRALVVLFKH